MRLAYLLALPVLVSALPAAAQSRDDDAVLADLVAAIQHRDVDAAKKLVVLPLEVTHFRFVDPKCTAAFPYSEATVDDQNLATFVGCMADVGVAKPASADEPYTYGPGSSLRFSMSDGKVASMASGSLEQVYAIMPGVFATHMKNYKPIVTPSAALKKAVDGAPNTRVVARVNSCVDANGHALFTIKVEGDAAYERDVRAATRTWRVTPFKVGKQAVPACTMLFVGYPDNPLPALPDHR